jgi:class 3 adenylate cyclase
MVVAHEVRKVVTVVFCDVVGSTALGESTDPEALRAVLARYFERMSGVVERHGGMVDLILRGDALLALAEVLESSGTTDEARARRLEALELYERKGSVPRAERTRALLAAAPVA